MASNTPKQMSSRLATMKFMQRSAGKNATSEPSTPNGPPNKKVRLSNGASAPGTPNSPAARAIPQSADERRREEAEARMAERLGETKWVLSFQDPLLAGRPPAMQVRQAGFAVIDAEDDSDDEEEQRPTRMQYGGGLKKKPATTAAAAAAATSESEESDSESESEESDGFSSDDPTAALIRETKREVAAKERDARKAKKSAKELPPRPSAMPDEDMDLAGLETLSGGGRKVECYKCGQKGHMKDQCPKSAPRGSVGRGRGRGAGRGKSRDGR
ncbi:hypothetical protein DM02DRAFT_611562 [Periconia macrospinosa]|uniref:CCHC-type domain-containing protein n=1 Tax=Periconia macrospinosa TaxID=97972 RepID=A0A2V1E219_9PLEO|nr:hypothetical protein DM02DRAFT_611562 [Periconia macrospinosa]